MNSEKKPLIGLTSSHNTQTDEVSLTPYCPRAILAAGGIPVILPLEASEDDLRQLARSLDGFLFTGGPDVHPFFFGEETREGCQDASVLRDRMELSLLKMAMEQRKPIMGICRGIQLINIGLGGTIFQDIGSQLPREIPIAHRQPFPAALTSHTVLVSAGSRLAAIAGSADAPGGVSDPLFGKSASGAGLRLKVNSTHHQAVKDPAPGLTPCAYAPDGVIEALEMDDYPYLIAVQWHPEYLWPKDAASLALFRTLTDAASAPRSGSRGMWGGGAL